MFLDPIQAKLKEMEQRNPSPPHPQSLLKTCSDRLYFLDRYLSNPFIANLNPSVLAGWLRNTISDKLINERDFPDKTVGLYAVALDEVGITKSYKGYQLKELVLDPAMVHGIAKTYLVVGNGELKKAFRTRLMEAIEKGGFEPGVEVKESPFNRLTTIIAELGLYSQCVKGKGPSGMQPWFPLEVAKFYAQGRLPIHR